MNLTEVSLFDPVYQLETTDPVLGGAGGIANRQAQNLANRTKFLLDAINALDGSGGPFNLDASGGALPTAGSGPAGAIKRKDLYVVTVAGTISSVPLQQGDELIARIDNAALITDYIVLQGNAVLATPTVLGLVKLAQDLSLGSAADATLSLAGLISLFAKLASPTFTGNPTTPDQSAGNNSQRIANTKYVDAAVSQEATNRNTAVTAEATARGSADTGLQNNIDTEATTRSNADTSEAIARSNADTSEATARSNADSNLQGQINNLAVKRVAEITLTANETTDQNIDASSLPNCKIGFWAAIEFTASGSDVPILNYSLSDDGYVTNILSELDTGYSGNVNHYVCSVFCPLPPGVTGKFHMGNFFGSTGNAVIKISRYI
jgi:hypothetical protein